jgi:hypothetical protein
MEVVYVIERQRLVAKRKRQEQISRVDVRTNCRQRESRIELITEGQEK